LAHWYGFVSLARGVRHPAQLTMLTVPHLRDNNDFEIGGVTQPSRFPDDRPEYRVNA
jgi:hypothetical protein